MKKVTRMYLRYVVIELWIMFYIYIYIYIYIVANFKICM